MSSGRSVAILMAMRCTAIMHHEVCIIQYYVMQYNAKFLSINSAANCNAMQIILMQGNTAIKV